MHGDREHLMTNMFDLLVFGTLTEEDMGPIGEIRRQGTEMVYLLNLEERALAAALLAYALHASACMIGLHRTGSFSVPVCKLGNEQLVVRYTMHVSMVHLLVPLTRGA